MLVDSVAVIGTLLMINRTDEAPERQADTATPALPLKTVRSSRTARGSSGAATTAAEPAPKHRRWFQPGFVTVRHLISAFLV